MYLTTSLTLLSSIVLLIPTISSAAINTTPNSSGIPSLLPRQSTTSSLTLTDDAEFRRTMLAGHNFYRSQHGAEPVIWNDQRALSSTSHSKACVFRHSGTKGVGENIAYGFPDVARTVNAWGSERLKYNYARPGYSSATGHFTAIVWKSTTAIGCGRTRCTNGLGWLIVCQYTPQGNIIGTASFTANVGRQISGMPADIWNGV